ncbi:hypothetical protein AVDCRST_MAG84-5941 [uncultured Microcoleus sp.]|uniref:Uncharacterized protein n=1 Tax=uncultured Microcoleus sp. TaxID=259945 RepID=A0A6J4NU85_9CYAN|nr:hypothetical protein AVDCRST_MAG84-5941 [uncultured Microcoleus sp.]
MWSGFDAVEYSLKNRLSAALSHIYKLGQPERIKRKSEFLVFF